MTNRHIKLIVSDCHLGSGARLKNGKLNPLEDFYKDDKFSEFLDYHTSGDFADVDVELIINGDFFDLLQVITSGNIPYGVLENTAIYKIRKILEGHPKVCQALKTFIEKGHRVIMIWGNHDAGLWWPGVQEEIRKTISRDIIFQFDPYTFDGVRVEHGHQYEIFHQFDLKNIFIERKGKRILNEPFGSFFVSGFLARLKLKRQYITNVIPFNKYLRWSMLFDFWFFFIQGLRAAVFFINTRFVYHPMRFSRFSKTVKILGEAFNRPKFAELAPGIMRKHHVKALIMGHDHQAMHLQFADGTQYLNTGTWTDVTSFDPGTLGRLSRPTYAFIEYPVGTAPGQGVLPRLSLKVWRGKYREWELF